MFHKEKPSLIDEVRKRSSSYLVDMLKKFNGKLINDGGKKIIEFSNAEQARNFFAECHLVVPEAKASYSNPSNFKYSDAVFPLNPSTNKRVIVKCCVREIFH